MNIQFKETKTNKIYRDYVEEPTNRARQRAFDRTFGSQIAAEAVKLHQRLLAYGSAAAYNRDYGQTLNRIETLSGVRDKAPMVLKVRVTGAWRKLFCQVVDSDGALLLKRDWTGDFGTVVDIWVIDVNNHDYAAV